MDEYRSPPQLQVINPRRNMQLPVQEAQAFIDKWKLRKIRCSPFPRGVYFVPHCLSPSQCRTDWMAGVKYFPNGNVYNERIPIGDPDDWREYADGE